ncbi:hypothetical protein APY04_0796 [Hyphomicrobium sulfonivorans]|uniref:Mobile element protein n=1 Tax=Hyphomicrobium sulfonivorans TaxID=121290 RepID=A0A120CXB9_HYPSL|nr:hypothetical protein APY04_0796 [Hyphomicrobium sulfonivorans]
MPREETPRSLDGNAFDLHKLLLEIDGICRKHRCLNGPNAAYDS